MTIESFALSKKISAFFTKYHAAIFALFTCLLLGVATYLLYAIINSTNITPTDATSTITGFDQQTADKIKNLRDSKSGTAQLELPSSRQSPFSE